MHHGNYARGEHMNMTIDIKVPEPVKLGPGIYVVGIGGAGNNAIDRMIENGNNKVKYVAINTDNQILSDCRAEFSLQIGAKLTGGNGAGADPVIGEAAAEESKDDIKGLLSDADMVVLTCGLGGGTGTGAIPVIARLCKEAGILTAGVVTLPFSFEGPSRVMAANEGLEKLAGSVDTLFVIPNDKLLEISDKDLELEEAFLFADNILKYTIDSVTTIIFNKGIVNVDFNDIRTTLKDKGIGHLGIGIANESKTLLEAVKDAIDSPLLTTDITNATNILINMSGRLKMKEINEAIEYVKELAGPHAQIIWGTVTDEEKVTENTSVVTLIATGLKSEAKGMGRLGISKDVTMLGQVSEGAPMLGQETVRSRGPRLSGIPNNLQKVKPSVAPKEIVIPDFLVKPTTPND